VCIGPQQIIGLARMAARAVALAAWHRREDRSSIGAAIVLRGGWLTKAKNPPQIVNRFLTLTDVTKW
jgi:hypothetical protein